MIKYYKEAEKLFANEMIEIEILLGEDLNNLINNDWYSKSIIVGRLANYSQNS